MHTPIRWGMIGCGDVTERKSGPAYRLAAGSTLAAVSARRPEAAADYARRHGVPRVFDDIAAMIRSPDIDAVYVATPPDSHAEYALAVAAAGKPCCVEKPIAPSFAEAQRMVAAFANAGQPLFVAYYRRALPRFDQVRDWLAEGAIGAVRQVNWTLTRPARPSDSGGWRTTPGAAPGGLFDDLACHGLDLFDDLLGPIVSAGGHRQNQSGVGAVPDAVAASWRHHGGALGSGIWNFAADRRRDAVTIIGDRGEIDFAIFEGGDVTLRAAGAPVRRAFADPDPIQLHHVERVTAQLLGGPAYAATGVAAARTAWVMDAILAGGGAT